jgi:hypothetical protein
MEILSQAMTVLRQAEGELRQLLFRAAEQSDYESVRLLAQWAEQLGTMVKKDTSNGDISHSAPAANGSAQAFSEPGVILTDRQTVARKSRVKRTRKSKRSRAAKGEYPNFLRDGDELLKIGWSKRQKSVYRHKAPRQVVFLFAELFQRTAQNGDRFIMEQVLPVRDPESDTELPSYQAYLTLAWLRREKLIVQHGRQGYSLNPGTDLVAAVQERWGLLPES